MWTATTCHAFFPVSTSHADPVKMPAINVETHQIAAQLESCSLSSRMSSETLNFCLLLSLSGIMLGVIIQMDKSGNKQQDYNYVYQALQSYVSSKYVGGPKNSRNC
jgi:hypothetical protein